MVTGCSRGPARHTPKTYLVLGPSFPGPLCPAPASVTGALYSFNTAAPWEWCLRAVLLPREQISLWLGGMQASRPAVKAARGEMRDAMNCRSTRQWDLAPELKSDGWMSLLY